MKKHIVTSLLLFIPFVAGAADYCTNPKEYTVDKRCYVTDEQKKLTPYNAVVALVKDDGFVYCTGTIVEGKNEKTPYLYTAKHCTDKDKNGISDNQLSIKLQDGRVVYAYKNNVGNYDIKEDDKFRGDWAVYSLKESNLPMINKTDIRKNNNSFGMPYSVWVVGYGALKIMSDREIQDFKENYIDYLKKKTKENITGKEAVYGFHRGGVDTTNTNFIDYRKRNGKSYWSLMGDSGNLKVSTCTYTDTGRRISCQTWGGNSGGPIFDAQGHTMGILTRGGQGIGGEIHAGKSTSGAGTSVQLFKEFLFK